MANYAMEVFPLNLVFAVAIASAALFIGFLPTRNIRSPFFKQETVRLGVAWMLVAMTVPSGIAQYPVFIGLFCLASWWQFRRDRALSGKMWFSIGSGLGISIGVMLILAVTPRAYPPDLPAQLQPLLLASIYLGGAVVGLAYANYSLVQQSEVPGELIRRYIGLLMALVLARAAVLWAFFFFRPAGLGPLVTAQLTATHLHDTYYQVPNGSTRWETLLLLGLVSLVLPVLAFVARRAVRQNDPRKALSLLAGVGLIGFFAETLARLLVL